MTNLFDLNTKNIHNCATNSVHRQPSNRISIVPETILYSLSDKNATLSAAKPTVDLTPSTTIERVGGSKVAEGIGYLASVNQLQQAQSSAQLDLFNQYLQQQQKNLDAMLSKSFKSNYYQVPGIKKSVGTTSSPQVAAIGPMPISLYKQSVSSGAARGTVAAPAESRRSNLGGNSGNSGSSTSSSSSSSSTSNSRDFIPFKCPLCTLIYRTQAFLNEHMRKEHSVLI